MFGAWQAGAWSVLSAVFEPELVVGASIGSVNGWAIASGCTPEELAGFWTERAGAPPLEAIAAVCSGFRPRIRYALVVTDVLARRTRTFEWPETSPAHVAASCSVPPLLWPRRIGGRWYADGGFYSPLPVAEAIQLGATRILALNAIAGLRFPALARGRPPQPSGKLVELRPGRTFGGFFAMLRHRPERVREWLELGQADGRNLIESEKHFLDDCFERK